MNIIFICSDILRRDYLSLYGNNSIHTPYLEKLGKESVIFERHYGASFPTMPTRADWFTGRWTFIYMGWNPLNDDEVLLAEVLQKNGYTTLGVVDTPFFNRKGYNYDRGFHEFIRVPGQDVDERARIVSPCYRRYREHGLTDEDMAVARATYSGEMTMVDHWVGYLLAKIESMNLMDNTAIIFTTDHGFYFGEYNGLFGKMVGIGGTFGAVDKADANKVSPKWYRSPLYEEISHIPLIMKIPGMQQGRTFALSKV